MFDLVLCNALWGEAVLVCQQESLWGRDGPHLGIFSLLMQKDPSASMKKQQHLSLLQVLLHPLSTFSWLDLHMCYLSRQQFLQGSSSSLSALEMENPSWITTGYIHWTVNSQLSCSPVDGKVPTVIPSLWKNSWPAQYLPAGHKIQWNELAIKHRRVWNQANPNSMWVSLWRFIIMIWLHWLRTSMWMSINFILYSICMYIYIYLYSMACSIRISSYIMYFHVYNKTVASHTSISHVQPWLQQSATKEALSAHLEQLYPHWSTLPKAHPCSISRSFTSIAST